MEFQMARGPILATVGPTQARSIPMSVATNDSVIRRWIQAYNERDVAGEEAVRSDDFVGLTPGLPPFDNESWKQFVWGFSASFPDLHLTVEDTVSEQDRVAARVTFRGTHQGEFMGIPPTGKQVTFSSMEMNRMRDGKVAEHRVVIDMLSLLQQLGVVPTPG
jgi:steroid delta-isomerase-like uncharacterized protein